MDQVTRFQVHKRMQKATKTSKTEASCFGCWHMKRNCQRGTLSGCCRRCHDLGLISRILDAPSLEQSDVKTSLNGLVSSTPSLSPHVDKSRELILSAIITTTQLQRPRNSARITINQPLYPCSGGTLTHEMDELVQILRLDIRSKDMSSRFIPLAALIGAYLCLIFPMGSSPPELDISVHLEKQLETNTEADLRSHVTKFAIFRFSELVEDLMEALRALYSLVNDLVQSRDIISASGVVYCEIDNVLQGFRNGNRRLLCENNELESALRSWLGKLCEEVGLRLRNTCPLFPTWADQLERPWSDARRSFGLYSISLSLELSPHLEHSSRVSSLPPPGPSLNTASSQHQHGHYSTSTSFDMDNSSTYVPMVESHPSNGSSIIPTWSSQTSPSVLPFQTEGSLPPASLAFSYHQEPIDAPFFGNWIQSENLLDEPKVIPQVFFPQKEQDIHQTPRLLQTPWSNFYGGTITNAFALGASHCPCCRFHYQSQNTLRSGSILSPCSQAWLSNNLSP